MKKIERVNIDAYNKYMGVETLHPLVSIIDFSKLSPIHSFLFNIGFYAVFLKETKNGTLTYDGSITTIRKEALSVFLRDRLSVRKQRKKSSNRKVGGCCFTPT